jgi:F0F1-type ATP synthase assembly protein I
MSLADRRWRYAAVIPVVAGAVVMFIGNLGDETFLGLPSVVLGGALVGLGVALFILSRDAEKKRNEGDQQRSE